MKILNVVLALYNYTLGKNAEEIIKKYNIEPGDFESIKSTVIWIFLYLAGIFDRSKVYRIDNKERNLRKRIFSLIKGLSRDSIY